LWTGGILSMDEREAIPVKGDTIGTDGSGGGVGAPSGVAWKRFEDIAPLLVTPGGLLAQAEEALKRSLKSDPQDTAALRKLATICRSRGNLAGALDAYTRLVALEPDDVKAGYLQAVLRGQDPPSTTALPGGRPAPFVRIEGFLSPREHEVLLATAHEQQGRLEVSLIGDGDGQYNPERRSAWVLSRNLERHIPWFLPRVKDALPSVLPRLQVGPFPVGEVELQMTVHRSGGFYKIHQDNGKEESRGRRVSYVYYFYRVPRRFTGGDLLLYDTDVTDGACAAAFTRIEALDNSIVFFPSVYCHQVTTVHCETEEFGDSRFTLNGWFHALDVEARAPAETGPEAPA
jgi:Rps23 Pro-64 3,4-dihydroxylase Tpa1-like proline 4-hydroxylase